MYNNLNILYLFTTFPKKSETFLKREINSLLKLNVNLTIYSLWGGDYSYKNLKIIKYNKIRLLYFPYNLLKLCFKHPIQSFKIFKKILTTKPNSVLNLAENFIGFAFALDFYKQIQDNDTIDIIHAVWATMPATAALIISELTNIPFSMGAHAYDIFEKQGDTFLKEKLNKCQFIHTSTYGARNKLIEISNTQKNNTINKINVIRRGINNFPSIKKDKTLTKKNTIHFISVGRLVEKKGFFRQLKIYLFLKNLNFKFIAFIIGDGPLKYKLQKEISNHGLENHVFIKPWVKYSELQSFYYEWADIFIFTGLIARNGDKDGLPNVIPEAMVKGIPVVSSSISAVPEVIKSWHNGVLITSYDSDIEWVSSINKLISCHQIYQSIKYNARHWVENNFDSLKNTKSLCCLFNKYKKYKL